MRFVDQLKNLLLPLALVFGAVAIFESGIRYGAANMRAHGIAGELQLPLNVYVTGSGTLNEQTLGDLAQLIDNGIAAGSMLREVWYFRFLKKESKERLERTLAYAFSVRGDAVIERFETLANDPERNESIRARFAEIKAAVEDSKVDLIDKAPSVQEQEQPTAEPEEGSSVEP